jgi:FkbM family methyltransferase
MIRYLIDRYFIKRPRVRSAITRFIYGSSDREVDIFGTRLVVNSLRENGYVRAAKRMNSSSLLRDEVGVLLSLSMLLRRGDTFVDVGANVGIFCCTLNRINRLCGESVARFYAYEPHPDTFKRLQINVSGTDIVARNVAVSDRTGELDFVDGAVSHVFTLAERSSAYNVLSRHLRVPSVRIEDEPIEGDSIVLKIDVEQQEFAVLEGAQKWFEAGRVKAVYLDNYADEKKVDAFLRHFGFRFFNGRSVELQFKSGFGLLAVHRNKWNHAESDSGNFAN